VQSLQKGILDNDNSMMQSKSFINGNKFEADMYVDTHANIFDISTSNIMRGGEILNNSHLSLINSAMKNTKKGNNMSIDSSHWVKIKADKDKHQYSIVPFEYKVKSLPATTQLTQTNKLTTYNHANTALFSMEPHNDKNDVLRKSDMITETKDSKPSLSLKHKKSKRRVKSISSDISEIEGQVHNDMNISNNSIAQSNDESFRNANKEIVFELGKEAGHDSQSKHSSLPEKIVFKPKTPASIKDVSYESPQKWETEEEWNFKLPSIKSSSGNDNFRHSESEHKDQNNNSLSIEMLEKSAEVTMFITEKDLSPRNLNDDGQNSHIRSRINSLRINDPSKITEDGDKTKSLRASDIDKIDMNKENINNEEMVSSTKADNQKLLKKFEMMKEPGINILEQVFKKDSDNKSKKAKQTEHSEHCVDLLYEYIIENVMTDMFPQRVNVELLRSSSNVEINQDDENQSQSNDVTVQDTSTSEKNDQSDDDQSQSDLKLITDSNSVQKYVNEIMDEIQANFFPQTVENLSKPLRFDNLRLLRDLQGFDYNVEPSPEYETKPIADIQIYLNKERNDKARKEKVFDEKIEGADDSDPQNSIQMRKKLFNYLWELEHIHHKAIFDAVNESLDRYRPYGIKGSPAIWSSNARKLTNNWSSTSLMNEVFGKVKSNVHQWSKTLAGALLDSELIKLYGYQINDSTDLANIKEDRLALMLSAEIEEFEQRWTDYEHEITITKIDIADLIFNTLTTETAEMVNSLGSRIIKT
jgi:hypothetical protein